MKDDENQIDYLKRCLYALIFFGVGQSVSAILMGEFIDKFGSKKATFVNILVISVVLAITLVTIRRKVFDWTSFLMCFLWGLQDGTVNTHTL